MITATWNIEAATEEKNDFPPARMLFRQPYADKHTQESLPQPASYKVRFAGKGSHSILHYYILHLYLLISFTNKHVYLPGTVLATGDEVFQMDKIPYLQESTFY